MNVRVQTVLVAINNVESKWVCIHSPFYTLYLYSAQVNTKPALYRVIENAIEDEQ